MISKQFGNRTVTDVTKLSKQSELRILNIEFRPELIRSNKWYATIYYQHANGEILSYNCKNLFTVNTKLVNTSMEANVKLLGFNLPALTATRFHSFGVMNELYPNTKNTTCPSAGVCSKGCYAMINNWLYTSTIATNDIKYYFSLLYPLAFNMRVQYELNQHKPDYVRIHASGDFYSKDYAFIWLGIIRNNPGIKFYAYTKEHRLFKKLANLRNVIPSNFTYILSEGSKHDLIKPGDRHARVFKPGNIPAGYVNASHNDLLAIGKNKCIGLEYH